MKRLRRAKSTASTGRRRSADGETRSRRCGQRAFAAGIAPMSDNHPPCGAYPATRLRRTRASAWSRALHRETVLTPADLIWPLFVTEGEGAEKPVASLPGVSRWSADRIVDRAKEAAGLGIPCIALFP